MTPFRLAWLNLVRHKAATVLAVLSLGLMVACAGLLLRTWKTADARFGGMAIAGDAVVGAKAGPVEMILGGMNLEGRYPPFIPLQLYVTLMNDTWQANHVGFARSIVPLVFCGRYRGLRVVGTTQEFLGQPQPAPDVRLDEGHWPVTEQGIVLGWGAANREKIGVGDEIAVTPWASDDPLDQYAAPRTLKVTGVLRRMGNAWDNALYTNLVQAEVLVASGAGHNTDGAAWQNLVLHYLIIHLRPGGMAELRGLINQRTIAQAVPVEDALRELRDLTGTERTMGLAVVMLALCLTAAAVTSLMLGRFEGLARQMAVLEAVGYRRASLHLLLAWEGLLLGLGAVLIGGLLDAALFPPLRHLLAASLPGPEVVRVPVWSGWIVWVACAAGMALASVLSSLFIFRGRTMERLRGLA